VGAEHHDRPFRHVVDAVDKDHALVAEPLHHMLVVHDLVIDINGLAGADLQELIDHVDRHVDAGTESAGVGKQQFHQGSSWATIGLARDDSRRVPPSVPVAARPRHRYSVGFPGFPDRRRGRRSACPDVLSM
jgi:hypothetical protein